MMKGCLNTFQFKIGQIFYLRRHKHSDHPSWSTFSDNYWYGVRYKSQDDFEMFTELKND